MKCRWDWTAQEIKKIFFFRLLAHLKSRLARGKNYQLFGGHMEKSIVVWSSENAFPIAAMFSTAAQKLTTENTGCVLIGGKNDVTHPWGVLMTDAKENSIGGLQC